jgi:hypothetical protein
MVSTGDSQGSGPSSWLAVLRPVGECRLEPLGKAGWQAAWVDTFGNAPQEWAEWLVAPESLPLPLGILSCQHPCAARAEGSLRPY